ncbi:hypothetical protein [Pseudarthrobacter cellobiosi]|nr:hypothetical protein [Pseudarthrobacter sp. HLT3-5]
MTFGEKLLNTAGEYAGRQPSEIAAEYEQVVLGLVSENKVEG